jgi:tetratricopeptide (TPR) repeat protein
VAAQNNLAWLLATVANSQLRNGGEALKLARRANQLSGSSNPLILRTLAAAYAETGDFKRAISAAHAALAADIKEQVQLYETGLPFHEPK